MSSLVFCQSPIINGLVIAPVGSSSIGRGRPPFATCDICKSFSDICEAVNILSGIAAPFEHCSGFPCGSHEPEKIVLSTSQEGRELISSFAYLKFRLFLEYKVFEKPVGRIQKEHVCNQNALRIRQRHFQLRENRFERKYRTILMRDRNLLRATFLVQYYFVLQNFI